MSTCPKCGQPYRDGVLVCGNCGEILIDKPTDFRQTGVLNVATVADIVKDLPLGGTATFKSSNRLRLKFAEAVVVVPKVEKLYLGRDIHEVDGGMSLNLTPYGAYACGVSRLHAEISLVDNSFLQLSDLHSTNGTFLNGEQLKPLRPYRLHDGDYIRLGKLALTIHFETETN